MATNQELVELQKTIYESKNPTRRWLHCLRRDWLLKKIEEYSLKYDTENSLEVGPGSGLYLPYLSTNYFNVLAVDIENAYLEHAKIVQSQHSNLHLKIDDMTCSSLATNSFDFILCSEVVEHTLKSQEMIQEMFRILKPNGILLLSTPQPYSFLELTAKIAFLPGIIQIVRFIYNEPIIETGHINLMSEKVITQQIANAGFSILETHKTGFYIPLLAELTGHIGLNIEKWFAQKLYKTPLDWMLWTQYYVLQKPT